MPKVSVVIPTYNRPHLIEKAVNSVLNQTYKDLEVIVVDDGAKKAREVVGAIEDSRVRYIDSGVDLGAPVARNKGIKDAKGEYVALLDDDDEWLPEKLEKQVVALDSCGKEVVMVFCGFNMHGNGNNFIRAVLPNQSGAIWPFERVLHRSYIWTSTLMVRASVAKELLFDERLKKHQEWDFQLRLLKIGKFYAIDEALVKLNVSDDEWHLGSKSNIGNVISAFEFFLKKHYSDYKKHKKSLAYSYQRLGTLYRENKEYSKAAKTLFKAWLARPLNPMYFLYILNLIPFALIGEKKYNSLRDVFRFKK